MNISLKEEIHRKLFHILIMILPVSYFFLSKKQFLSFLLPIGIGVIAIDFYCHKFPWLKAVTHKVFGKIIRKSEVDNGLSGLSFMFLAAIVVFSVAPKVIAVNAFTILAISDAVASLIGKRIKSQPFFEKSVAGSVAFALSALLIFIIYGLVFDQKLFYYSFGLCAVFAVTIIEARPSLLKLDDNLTIPLVFTIVMLLFSLIWKYSY